MATITPRKRKSGTQYTARVRIKKAGRVIHDESETFVRRAMATAWATKRELQLKTPGYIESLSLKDISFKQVLQWYKDDYDGDKKFSRTKLSSVNFLIGLDNMEDIMATGYTSGQLVAHARMRTLTGTGPSTINQDFIWLRVALQAVKIERDLPFDIQALEDAAFICRRAGLICKSNTRKRRPTLVEINILLTHFAERDKRSVVKMVDVVQFAMFSSRRQDEICRIKWADLDRENNKVLVRDMKHPKMLVDTLVSLPDKAMEIINRQTKVSEYIFPYKGKTASAAFTRACSFLGIEDLRFHDLRRECISWLFEQGWTLPQVASVSGHKAWTSLQTYTALEVTGDKYIDFTLY